MRSFLKNACAPTVIAWSFMASAEIPSIGDVVKEIPQSPQNTVNKTQPVLGGGDFPPPLIEDESASDTKKFVSRFIFLGNTALSNDELQKFVVEYVGKEYTFGQLEAVVSEVTKHYRSEGYFVARAYIPVGGYTDGVVTVRIIEGQIGDFKISNESLLTDDVVEKFLNGARGKSNVVSVHSLERGMLLLNDSNGALVTRADVMPGTAVGTSDFSIEIKPTKGINGYVVADNFGSRYTGKHRLNVGGNWISPFKLGDKLSVSALTSAEHNGIFNASLSYEFPINYQGTRLRTELAKTTYSLHAEYDSLDATGEAVTANLSLGHPIWRTRLRNLYLDFGITAKELTDEIGASTSVTKKQSWVSNIGLKYDNSHFWLGRHGDSNVEAVLSFGNLSFEDVTSKTNDAAGAKTEGDFGKVVLNARRSVNFDSGWRLDGKLEAQHALGRKNLDGSEDLSIGGSGGVRLYPSGDLSAENGVIVSVESSRAIKPVGEFDRTVSLFYDAGWADMANNNVEFDSRVLQNLGMGMLFNHASGAFIKLEVARKLGHEQVTSEPEYRSKALIQIGKSF